MLICQGISKKFGDEVVLNNFDFQMSPGEIVGLVGKSGSGKTTFMRILTNLETLDSGSVSIDDVFLYKNGQLASKKIQSNYQKKIGLVFQNYALFPNLSVIDNIIEAPSALDGTAKTSIKDLKEKAMGYLKRFGLEDKADMMPKQLSGGQKQRVAIIRSLILNPSFICFDEPTSALDDANQETVGSLINEISEMGKGVIIVTHDNDFADKTCSRLISSTTFK